MTEREFKQCMLKLTRAGLKGSNAIGVDVWYDELKKFDISQLEKVVSDWVKSGIKWFPALGELYQKCKLTNKSSGMGRPDKLCKLCGGFGFVSLLHMESLEGEVMRHCPCKTGEQASNKVIEMYSPSGKYLNVLVTDEARNVCRSVNGYADMEKKPFIGSKIA